MKCLRTGNGKGFTLIELLMVIAIIGMLAAIAVPMFMGQRDRAKRTAIITSAKSSLNEVDSILDDFLAVSPVLFMKDGNGNYSCYEFNGAPLTLKCISRFPNVSDVQQYTQLGELLDKYVDTQNNVLGEQSPFGTGALYSRAYGVTGRIIVANTDSRSVSVVVNSTGGDAIFDETVRAR